MTAARRAWPGHCRTAWPGDTGVHRGYRWLLHGPACAADGVLAPEVSANGVCSGCSAPRLGPLLDRLIAAYEREHGKLAAA